MKKFIELKSNGELFDNNYMNKGFYFIGGDLYFVDDSSIVNASNHPHFGIGDEDMFVLESNAIKLNDGSQGLLSVRMINNPFEIDSHIFIVGEYDTPAYLESMYVDLIDYLEEDDGFSFEVGSDFLDTISKKADLFYNCIAYPESDEENNVVILEYVRGLYSKYRIDLNGDNLVAFEEVFLHDKLIEEKEPLFLGLYSPDEMETKESFLDLDFSDVLLEKILKEVY